MKKIIISLILSSSILFSGCVTTGTSTAQGTIDQINPYLVTGASVAASAALAFGVSDSDRVIKAKSLYGMAAGLRSLSGGTVPTAEELKNTLNSFAISDGEVYANMAQSISNLYAKEFSKIQGDPKAALDVIEALAEGIEQGAAPFLK